ncbi:histidine kinase dimerization/phosphoacceptor domain -containing protein [Spirosoma litoris]
MKKGWALPLILVVLLSGRGQSQDSVFSRLHAQIQASQPDTNRVSLLLQLSREYVFKKGELVSDLDTALKLSQQAQALSQALQYPLGVGRSYLTTAQALREKGDKNAGRRYARQAIGIFTQFGYKPELVEGYLELALSYWINKQELPQRIDYTQKALAVVKQLNDKVREANLLKELADFQQLRGEYTQAVSELRQALALCQTNTCMDMTGLYDLLGYVSTKLGDYREGLKYGLLAIQRTEQYHDTGLLACTAYNRVGLTYFAMGQYRQAYRYFKKSYALAQKNNYNPSIIQVAGNLSMVLLSMHQPQRALTLLKTVARKNPPLEDGSRIHLAMRFIDVYRTLKQYSLAQHYCDQIIALTPKEGWESIGQVSIYQSLIRFYIASGQYAKASQYLTENDALCRRNSSPIEQAQNYLLWFQLDTTQRQYPQAIRHYQQFVDLRDSLLNETKSRQIAQLEIQYQIQQKDNAIRLNQRNIQLLTNRSQLQTAQLQQARTTRNSIIVVVVLLAGLLGVSYNRYRLKQRSNQLLEAKQLEINQKNSSLEQILREKENLLDEKEWMLKEIHHRVKNNLQIISSMLNAQSDFLQDPKALMAIKDSQNRVQAMALIHQKLYQSDNLALVNMAEFIDEIVDYLMESFLQTDLVRTKITVAAIQLDVTQAIPLGLIINEAVTNSLKYAFPQNRAGLISIQLQPEGTQLYRLTISDDGVGLPAGLDLDRTPTLGLTMIRGLSRQMGGKLRIHQDAGVQIQLEFSQTPKASRAKLIPV